MESAFVEVLSGEDCRELLRRHHVGRLGVVRGGYPQILPVNYLMFDDRVVVRTDTGGKFSSARQQRVCFEIDGIDERARAGWSVLVQGFAVELLPDDPRYQTIAQLPLHPWAPGDKANLLLITAVSVTGRKIGGDGARARR